MEKHYVHKTHSLVSYWDLKSVNMRICVPDVIECGLEETS